MIFGVFIKIKNKKNTGPIESPKDDVIFTINEQKLIELWELLNTQTGKCPKRVAMGGMGCNGYFDGSKEICLDKDLPNDGSCLIYSFGVADEVTFEEMLSEYVPNCSIHMFDPSIKDKNIFPEDYLPSNCFLHYWGITENDINDTMNFENKMMAFYTLQNLKKKLGHEGKKIHIIKMDIEGFEWKTLEQILSEHQLNGVDQLIMELHFQHVLYYQQNQWIPYIQDKIDIINNLEDEGFRRISYNPNPIEIIKLQNKISIPLCGEILWIRQNNK